jgi:hypothetical protein
MIEVFTLWLITLMKIHVESKEIGIKFLMQQFTVDAIMSRQIGRVGGLIVPVVQYKTVIWYCAKNANIYT